MISLYADEDIPFPLVKALRLEGIKVIATKEANMLGKTDEEQLQYAFTRDLVLLSHNVKDFVVINQKYLEEGISHSGIIVSKKDQLGVLLRKLLHLTSTLKAEDMRNRIEFLGNW